MQPGIMGRVSSGTAEPHDLQQILLSAQDRERLDYRTRNSLGHIDVGLPNLSTGEVNTHSVCFHVCALTIALGCAIR